MCVKRYSNIKKPPTKQTVFTVFAIAYDFNIYCLKVTSRPISYLMKLKTCLI